VIERSDVTEYIDPAEDNEKTVVSIASVSSSFRSCVFMVMFSFVIERNLACIYLSVFWRLCFAVFFFVLRWCWMQWFVVACVVLLRIVVLAFVMRLPYWQLLAVVLVSPNARRRWLKLPFLLARCRALCTLVPQAI